MPQPRPYCQRSEGHEFRFPVNKNTIGSKSRINLAPKCDQVTAPSSYVERRRRPQAYWSLFALLFGTDGMIQRNPEPTFIVECRALNKGHPRYSSPLLPTWCRTYRVPESGHAARYEPPPVTPWRSPDESKHRKYVRPHGL